MTNHIVVFAGLSRSLPDVASFVTPVFRTVDGNYVRQEVENSKISSFIPISIGEEFAPISFPLASQLSDDAVYAFEVSTDDFFVGGRQSLCKVLAHTLSHLTKEKVGASTWSAVERFLRCPSTGFERDRPIFRCSKIANSTEYVINSYGLDGIERLVRSVQDSSVGPDHEKSMTPEEAALMLAVIPLNKEVSATLMLRYFSRNYGITITEEQVLDRLCQGLSTPEIAVEMNVSVSTIRSHVRSLCAKTRSGGVRELANKVGSLTMLAASGGYMHEYRVGAIEGRVHSIQSHTFLRDQPRREGKLAWAPAEGVKKSLLMPSELIHIKDADAYKNETLSELIDSIARDASALAEKVVHRDEQQVHDTSVVKEAMQLVARSQHSKLAVAEFVKEFQLEAEAAMAAVEISAAKVAGETSYMHTPSLMHIKSAQQRLQEVNSLMAELSSVKELSEAVLAAKVHDIFSVDIVASVGSWTTTKKMGELTRYAEHWSRTLMRLTS